MQVKLNALEFKVGCYRWGKPRRFVFENIKETGTFSNTVAGESFKINQNLGCNGKCLTYLFTYKACKKKYTSKTIDKFRHSWNS